MKQSESKGNDSSNFIWNSIGGCLNAGQSVLILMVITRVCGIETAGIFSIAYATGNLFLYLGNYGVRNYQVSDLREKYSFSDYLWHRGFTVLLMLLLSAGYAAYGLFIGGYSSYKAACVFAMCVLKAVDCLEEVFEGRFQQRGRLDRSGKLVTFRLAVSIGGMLAVLALTGDLLLSTWTAVLLALAASLLMIAVYRDTAALEKQPLRLSGLSGLMRECLPVCAANFLSFFIINEPKYAIDAAMDETAQACYNFIAMPVFVIQLLTMFIYQPMLIRMTQNLVKRDRKAFLTQFRNVVLGLIAIAVPVLLAARFPGIPVLSALYATDLTDYRAGFMLLMAGSIFLAFNGFCAAVLTLMRAQKRIPLLYLAGSVLSLLLTPRMTAAAGVYGACAAFVIVMVSVTVLMAAVLAGQTAQI